jgi:HEAT repeat protein
MPVYLIERNYAERLEVTRSKADGLNQINHEEGVQWLISFLSADKMKTYCLYEAPNAEAILAAARRAGLPADVIIEVSEVRPTGETGQVLKERFVGLDRA